jgi:hypothetical protein
LLAAANNFLVAVVLFDLFCLRHSQSLVQVDFVHIIGHFAHFASANDDAALVGGDGLALTVHQHFADNLAAFVTAHRFAFLFGGAVPLSK